MSVVEISVRRCLHATMPRDTVLVGTMYSTYDYAVLDWKLKLITCAMTTTI